MKGAYALLGFLFLIIIISASYALSRAKNPSAGSDMIQDKQSMTALSITSPAFENNGKIPAKYTCDLPASRQAGTAHISPPLAFSGVPEGAKSLALIMDDPDVPKQLKPDGVYDHWVLFNISPNTQDIPEGGTIGTAGVNSAGQNAYASPCPPPQYEPKEHRYIFALYALDTMLMLNEGAAKQEVLKAIEGHVIEQAELIGRYKRQ